MTTVLDRKQEAQETPHRARLDWVDNLRTGMIALVISMHACVTYSHVGSWYYNAPPEPSLLQKLPFVFWQAHLQSFFMGLLFFIAGYYADRSLAKRGPLGFLKERLRRLGIPTLLYMLAIHPLIVLGLHPGEAAPNSPLADYGRYLVSGRFVGSSGPMWFAFALLLFSVLLAVLPSKSPTAAARPLRLTPTFVVVLGTGIGLASFIVRTVQPLGTSVLNFQLCYFAQYVVAFALGVWVARSDALATVAASRVAATAGKVALVLGPLGLALVVAVSLPLPKSGQPPFNGGWNVPALGLAVWEQLTGVGLALGAIAWFAARVNTRTRASTWLSERSFAVYLLHPPILVGLALAAQPVRTNPFAMAVALTAVGLVASFAVADLAKRVPLLRGIL